LKRIKKGVGRRAYLHYTMCLLMQMALMLSGGLFAQNSPQVKVKTGVLSGFTDANGVATYLGIPFAQSPVTELRWRPPQPPSDWTGVREAKKFGANCIQHHATMGPFTKEFIAQGEFSEDCLFLNIWVDKNASSKAEPVMVFIHGGGFQAGSGSVEIFNGSELARKGVVVVTFNYRVGVLGFLVHPDLTKESPHHASGNYGLLDQIAALKWVKQNIHAFGGDPANVTIFGQSAGALSVVDLMESPVAQGLFVRGIAESGPGVLPPNLLIDTSLKAREESGEKFAQSLGAHSLAELRALPAEMFDRPPSGGLHLADGPVIDGWVLTFEPTAHQVPLMCGMVTGDTALYALIRPQPASNTVASFEKSAEEQFGPAANRFLTLYPVKQDADVPAMKSASLVDQARVSLDIWSAQQLQKSRVVYTYYFDRPIPWPAHPEFGAFHTAEVPYVFRSLKFLDRPWEKTDYRLSDAMSTYWTNFAKTGDPNGDGLPDWPAYARGDHVVMELGEHIGPIPVATEEKLEFFLEYLKKPQ